MLLSKLGSSDRKRSTRFAKAIVVVTSMATGTAIATNACNVESPEGTGGTDVTAGACGRGIIVVNSDYQSTNLSLVAIDGTVLSSSFLSSASTASGLSAPLGGDVVTPTQWQRGDEIVLLDRYPASVLTWVDVRSSTPTGQLSLATGFAANPRDYLLLNPTKAYVTRYQPNLAAGTGNHDEGSDIVVVDPLTRAVTTRLSLRSAMQDAPAVYYPYPDKMLRVGNEVAVLLEPIFDFMSTASSRTFASNPDEANSRGRRCRRSTMYGMLLSPSEMNSPCLCRRVVSDSWLPCESVSCWYRQRK